MLAVVLVSVLCAVADEDGGVEDAGAPEVPSHYDTGPLKLDGRVIDFYPGDDAPPPRPPWLHLKGNRVLPEEMYRNALQLPADAKPDGATAMYIEETLYGFLVKSGYELATVGAVVRDDGIEVQIDEGQLEKIVFTGRLTFNTLRFRLELFVDQEVFNRPALEKQIAELSKKIGIQVVRWSLVPTPNPDHVGPQIESLGVIEGFEMIHARKRYELWFYFQESEWDLGAGLDVRSNYIDGLELGLNYQGIGLFNDRWRVAASGGLGLRFRIADHQLYPTFSRAYAEFQWFTPKIGRVRAGIWIYGNLYGRQRHDLDVEDYKDANAIASFPVAIDLGRTARLTPTLGFQYRRVFDITPTTAGPNLAAIPAPSQRLRAFVELRGDFVFDPENQRWDRRHKLEVGARYYFGRSIEPMVESGGAFASYWWLYERYQKVFEIGWHDLFLTSHARVAFGDVQFQDEEPLGELLRGFGNNFVRKGGNVGVEFRFSLARDVLKASFFTHVAAYGEVFDRQRNLETLRFGLSAGPGFHALIQGMFQLDVYAAIGLRTRAPELSDGPIATSLIVILNKTY